MKTPSGEVAAKGNLFNDEERPVQKDGYNTSDMEEILSKGALAFGSDLESPDISLEQGRLPLKGESHKKQDEAKISSTNDPIQPKNHMVLCPSEHESFQLSTTGISHNLNEQKLSSTTMLPMNNLYSTFIKSPQQLLTSGQPAGYNAAEGAIDLGVGSGIAVAAPFINQRKIIITTAKTHVFKGDLMTKLDFGLSFPKMCNTNAGKDPSIFACLVYTNNRATTRPIAASYRFLPQNAKRSDKFQDSYNGIYEQLDNDGPPEKLEVILCSEAFVSHPADPQANSDFYPMLDHATVQTLALEVYIHDANSRPLDYSVSQPIFVTDFGLSIEALFDEAPFMMRLESSDKYPNEAVYAWHNKAGGENAAIYVKIHLRDPKGRVVMDHAEPLQLRTDLVFNDLSLCPKMPIYPLKRKPAQMEEPHPLFRRLGDDPVLDPHQGSAHFCFRIEEVSTTHAQIGGPGKSGFKLKVSIHESSFYGELISPGYMDETIIVRSKARREDLPSFPYQKALSKFRKVDAASFAIAKEGIKAEKVPTLGKEEPPKKASSETKSKKRKSKGQKKSDTLSEGNKMNKADHSDLPSPQESPDLCVKLVLDNGHCLWCKSVSSPATFRDSRNHTSNCIFALALINSGLDQSKEYSKFAASSLTPTGNGLYSGYTPIQDFQSIYGEGLGSAASLFMNALRDTPKDPELTTPFKNPTFGVPQYSQMPSLSHNSSSIGQSFATFKTGLSPNDTPGSTLRKNEESWESHTYQHVGMQYQQRGAQGMENKSAPGNIVLRREDDSRDETNTKARANECEEDRIPDDSFRGDIDCNTPSSAENVDDEVQIDDNIWDTEFTRNAELCTPSAYVKKEEEECTSFEAV